MKNIFIGIILLLTSACSIGPNYKAPELDLPEKFSENNYFESGEIETSWWKSFEDELLNDLVEKGVSQNKDIKQALSRINQSRALARKAFSELLPGKQFFGSYEKSKSSGARFPGDSNEGFEYEIYSGGIEASWEIDLFGRIRRDIESKNAEYSASVANFYDIIQIVISDISSNYFELRASQKQLEIAKNNAKLQQETFNLIENKYNLGVVSEFDLSRAKTQLQTTNAIIPNYKYQIDSAIHRLSVLIGKEPKYLEEKLTSTKDLPEFKGNFKIENPVDLIRRRPDLRSAERMLASQTALIGVAKGDLYPKITITGSLGVEAGNFSNLSSSSAETYRIGPRITWAALDVGRIRSQIKAQTERTEEALENYKQAVLLALEDVENSLSSYSSQMQRSLELEIAHEYSQKTLDIALARYEQGLIDFISVVDSHQTALEVESELIRTKQNLNIALVRVYKSIGGGWENWELKK